MFFGLLLTFLRTLYGFLRTKSCCFRTFLVFSELVPVLFFFVSEPVSELVSELFVLFFEVSVVVSVVRLHF